MLHITKSSEKYFLRVCNRRIRMTSQFYSCSFEDVYIGSVRDGRKRTGTPFPFLIQRERRLTFTRLILTLKQSPRMHQNALLPDKKI